MKSRKWQTAIATALLALTLTACGSNNAKDENEKPTEVVYSDELNVAITAQPPTLDSVLTVSAVALDIAGNIYQQLFQLDANYNPVPVLAESYKVSEDGKTYTIKLRQGVKFHNGEEMHADDVVASMNRWLTKSSRAKTLLEGANFTEVDEYTVQLTVQQATSDVLIIMASQPQFPAIMPKEMIETAPADGVTEYVGTGAYKFGEWKQDQYISLERFDEYVPVENAGESSGFTGEITAPTKTIKYHFVTDHATRTAGIQTGEYDIADSIPIENYEQLDANKDIELQTFPAGTLTAFFNTTEGALANKTLRQAVLAALNDEEIMLAAFVKPELYSLAPGYLSENHKWSSDAGKEYYNQANAEKAKELLTEAGYNGEEIVLLTTKDYNEMYTGTLVIQEQLRQIGMNVKVESYDFPTFLETKGDRSKWDLFLASTGFQLTPAQNLAVTPDWAGLNDETIASGLLAVRSASSDEEAKAEWDKVQQYMYENAVASVIGHSYGVVAINKDLEGFELFEAPVVWNAKIPKK